MTIQSTIGELLDTHKPAGTRWVAVVDDEGFKSAYGPFDLYEQAQTWTIVHGGEVIPLYQV